MVLNITELPYLIFRLGPIIVVSFFVFQSLLLWDLKGVIYIAGLLLTCLLTLLANAGLNIILPITEQNEKNPKCRTITIGDNGEYISNIPLNLTVYSFTFFYLLIFIFNLANSDSSEGILNSSKITQKTINSAIQQNIPVMIIFPVFILIELYWIGINNCISDDIKNYIVYAFSGIIIGGTGGILWAVLITSLKIKTLQYIVSKDVDVCSRPVSTRFKCRVKDTT